MAKVTASTILKEAAELKEKKQADYQGDRYTEEDYFPFGNISYLHMIHTKYLRIMNLAQSDGTTNFESLEDSLTDMSVYCAMFSAYLQNKKMEENDYDINYDIKEASIIDKINFEKGI